MSNTYTVRRDGDLLRVATTSGKAAGVLWGWAGDIGMTGDRGAIELYGDSTHDGWQLIYRWKLSSNGIAWLRRSLLLGLAEPEKYELERGERALYRELLRKLASCAHCGLLREEHANRKCLFDHTRFKEAA